MISEPTINTVYRFIRPLASFLRIKQTELAPKYLGEERLATYRAKQQENFAAELENFLPREKLILPDDEVMPMKSYEESYSEHYWRYFPIVEDISYRKGLERWSVLAVSYLNKRLHKILIFEPVQGSYYWSRLNSGAHSRTHRLRVNLTGKMEGMTLAITSDKESKIPQFIHQDAALVISSGSPLLDLIDCAAGRLDMFCSPNMGMLMPMAIMLIKEAGGFVCSLDGSEIIESEDHRDIKDYSTTDPAADYSVVAGNQQLISEYKAKVAAANKE